MALGKAMWLLLALVTMVRINPAAPSKHWDIYTNGDGGDKCGQNICLADEGVGCGGGRCKCGDMSPQGDGTLLCHTQYEKTCKLISDPTNFPFYGGKFNVPASCYFRLTSVKTQALVGGEQVGLCMLEVFAWGTKGRGPGTFGKHYIAGMDAWFTVDLNNGSQKIHRTRLSGWATNGMYKYSESGSNGGPLGAPVTTTIPDVGEIKTHWDKDNNLGEVRAVFCGAKVGFRAPEIFVNKSQPRFAPGVYIKLNVKHEPQFVGAQNTLCGTLSPQQGTIDNFIDQLEEKFDKRVTKEVAMMFLILTQGPPQNFPGANPALQQLANTAKKCNVRSMLCALEHCLFITNKAKFLKCWGRPGRKAGKDETYEGHEDEDEDQDEGEVDEGEVDEEHDDPGQKAMKRPLQLMLLCVKSYCKDGGNVICHKVQRMITGSTCKRYAPSKGSIMGDECDKPGRPGIEPL